MGFELGSVGIEGVYFDHQYTPRIPEASSMRFWPQPNLVWNSNVGSVFGFVGLSASRAVWPEKNRQMSIKVA